MRAEHWRAITELAAEQEGLVTSAQLRTAGASPAAINRLVAEGQLVPQRMGVLAVAGAPVNPERPLWAAALAAPRAVVSHRSAAWLHKLLAHRPRLVEMTVAPGDRLRMHGVVGFQGRLSDDDIDARHGIRATNVVRTLVDLWAVLPPDWVRRLVDDSVMRGLCTYDEVRSAAQEALVFDLLDDAQGTTPLELEWDRILREAGLPEPVRQYQIVIGDRIFVLDHAWPEHKVALEVNGFAAHRTRSAFDRDHDKVAALQAAGWSVVSATARSRRAHVLTALRRFLAFSTAAGAVEKAGG